MAQRRAVAGRPSGTDGSDFSYRMVVDPRYTKVAEGKSRLRILIAAQGFSLVLASLLVFLAASQERSFDNFAIITISIGFISLLIGEIGRRRSHVNLLRLYVSASSIATALSVACIIRSNLFFKVIQHQSIAGAKTYELVEAARILFGILLQVFVIITTISLVHNMSPKRAS
ncbi:Protein jagunal protein [Dioscorea alata]|uniref:Protein jagunal protein n=1 Tax=Dioscorea alata TaxID=55571 RepID=A0ACB7WFC6_DIOAL|nr:Protein jagunal protein [Dioscorea alata]